jgi:hypothetical protein
MQMHPDVNYISTHGGPGYLSNTPDDQTLQTMAQNGHPIVLSVCDGAAEDTPGDSAAASIASSSGADPNNVYACPGGVNVNSSGSQQCDGNWVTAGGNPIDATTRAQYGLQNCWMMPVPLTGATVAVWCK